MKFVFHRYAIGNMFVAMDMGGKGLYKMIDLLHKRKCYLMDMDYARCAPWHG